MAVISAGFISGSCAHIISALLHLSQLQPLGVNREFIENVTTESETYSRYRWLTNPADIRALFSALPDVIKPSDDIISRFIELKGEIHWNEISELTTLNDWSPHAFFIDEERGIPILKLGRRSLYLTSVDPFYFSEIPGIIHELGHFEFLLQKLKNRTDILEAWRAINNNIHLYRDSERRALVKEHQARMKLSRFLVRYENEPVHSLQKGRLLLSTGTYPEAEAMILGLRSLRSDRLQPDEKIQIETTILQMMKKSILYERSIRKNALPIIERGLAEFAQRKDSLSAQDKIDYDQLLFYTWLFRQKPLAVILSGVGGIGTGSRLSWQELKQVELLYAAALADLSQK